MNQVLSITAPVFLIIGLGTLCAWRGVFQAEAQKAFSLFVFYCAMPCYWFMAMARVPRSMLLHTDYLAAFAISMGCVAALGGIVARGLFRRDGPSTILAMTGTCHTNAAYMGVPIVMMAFGQSAPVIVIVLFQILVTTTLILTGIEICQKHKALSLAALRQFPQTVLLNPIVGGAMLGILFAFQEWPVPVVAGRTFDLLGGAGIPTALFALGLSLGTARPPLPVASRRLVALLVAMKIILHPLMAWVIGRYLFHLESPWLGALTVVAAMPTAVNNFVFAQRYDAFVAESSAVVFWSSVLSLASLSLLLMLFAAG